MANLILRRTAGVPRFVTYSLDYLKTLKKSSWTLADVTDNLLGDEFIKFLKNGDGMKDLRPFDRVEKSIQNLYLDFIALGALKIPIDVDHNVNLSHLGLELPGEKPKNDENFEVSLLEVLQVFNLFIEQHDKHWRLVFPEICLDEIDIPHPHLPFWKCFYKMACHEAFGSGDLLEIIGRNSFLLRLGETIDFLKQPTNLEVLLPFLSTSLCGARNALQLNKDEPVKKFPKLVIDYKSATPYELLNDQEKIDWDLKVEKFFSTINSDNVVLNLVDWN